MTARPGLAMIARRPTLLGEVLRAAAAMRKRGGVAPSAAYLAWRSHTAYGDNRRAEPTDLAHFLLWRRWMRRQRRGGAGR